MKKYRLKISTPWGEAGDIFIESEGFWFCPERGSCPSFEYIENYPHLFELIEEKSDVDRYVEWSRRQPCATDKEYSDSAPYIIGEKYLIRTVTYYYIGILKSVHEHELVLSSASWIADTGRYFDALKKGTLNEVEPIIGNAIIGRGALIDAVIWGHKTPEEQK